jgi:ankyrin repeat protein
MLGLAFYLSETRHTRETEAGQAAAIRRAVQDGDITALEHAVRRGANPNARDSFGDVALLDVREPAIAAALIRLGADVDARHRDDRDTLLIRAARMGDAALVKVLLAAGANAQIENARGETALREAVEGGHDEVVALLRVAIAATDSIPVERPSSGRAAPGPSEPGSRR